jgi:membrane dipeptidase
MGIEPQTEYMKGIESLEEWPNITRGLVARGYSDGDIEKIIGGNALRLMDRVIR